MPIATPPTSTELENHPVVSQDEWMVARRQLLDEEKQALKQLDTVSAKRRALPWVKIEKPYTFESDKGSKSLSDLFDGRSQLIVYHFMFGPGWKEGCDGCSFLSDHFDGANWHLPHHDVTLLAVSRAPLAEIQQFKKRMGWRFPWVSSFGSDFNYDFHASTPSGAKKILYNFKEIDAAEAGTEQHGISVFYQNSRGEIYHTYSAHSRGVDILCGAHHLLDLTPKGRNETSTMNWVRLHDQYETTAPSDGCCHS